MHLVSANAQHVGSRADQQDSFGFSDPGDSAFARHGGLVAVMCDGMGGLAHGRAASSLAVGTFLNAYAAKTEQEPVTAALERAARQANAAVYEGALRVDAEGNMGTTLVAAAIRESLLDWVSVGDSALYLYRDGSLRLLTTAHVYGQDLDQQAAQGQITTEEAIHHPDREALTSYVGGEQIRLFDLSATPVELRPGDRVVLSSDGLFRALNDEEIAAELPAAPQQACDTLIRKTLAKQWEHQDNVTVLCVGLEEQAPLKVQPPLPRRSRVFRVVSGLAAAAAAAAPFLLGRARRPPPNQP